MAGGRRDRGGDHTGAAGRVPSPPGVPGSRGGRGVGADARRGGGAHPPGGRGRDPRRALRRSRRAVQGGHRVRRAARRRRGARSRVQRPHRGGRVRHPRRPVARSRDVPGVDRHLHRHLVCGHLEQEPAGARGRADAAPTDAAPAGLHRRAAAVCRRDRGMLRAPDSAPPGSLDVLQAALRRLRDRRLPARAADDRAARVRARTRRAHNRAARRSRPSISPTRATPPTRFCPNCATWSWPIG